MIAKIISGGQTGVDRAALDVAIARGIPHGGFCPKGRRAEDGTIPQQYQLKECSSPDYPMRTALNVHHSDGTLVITRGTPEGGTRKTIELCNLYHKPHIIIDVRETPDAEAFADWLRIHHIQVLNVAGPRESKHPGMSEQAKRILTALLPQHPQ